MIFPMLLLAGMLLPIENGPGWLRFLSKLNPLTYIIDAERVLFAGTWPGRHRAGRGVVAAAVVAVARAGRSGCAG